MGAGARCCGGAWPCSASTAPARARSARSCRYDTTSKSPWGRRSTHSASHPRIDTTRVGLIGASLGGYYACRVAAFEPRVTAAVANCGPYSWIECWDELPQVTRDAFRKYSWSSSEEEAREKAKALDLTGVAEKIAQPLVVVHGMLDPLIGVDHAERIAEQAADATLIKVDDATHGVSNLGYRYESSGQRLDGGRDSVAR